MIVDFLVERLKICLLPVSIGNTHYDKILMSDCRINNELEPNKRTFSPSSRIVNTSFQGEMTISGTTHLVYDDETEILT